MTKQWAEHVNTDMTVGSNLLDAGEGIYDRLLINNSVSGMTSSNIYLMYFTALISEQVANVTTFTTGQGAVTPTYGKLGMYYVNQGTGDLNLLWRTLNDTVMWTAANTAYTKPLSDPGSNSLIYWHKLRGCRYALAFMSIAATTPTMLGLNSQLIGPTIPIYNRQPRIGAVYNGGPPTEMPGTISDSLLSINATQKFIYAELTP